MNAFRYIRQLCALLFFLLPFCLTAQGQRTHTIAKGETLYSVSRLYGVSQEALCKANAGLSADNFPAGVVLTIPTMSAPQNPVKGLAGSDCREMHRVKKKETLYSIAEKYGVTLEQLRTANPETQRPDYSLKKDDFLCIPFVKAKNIAPTAATASVPAADNKAAMAKIRPTGVTEKAMTKIRVALLLPFKAKDANGSKAIEFYQGFLLAVDSLRRQGLSTEIVALSVSHADELAKALSSPLLPHADLVIAPFSQQDINAVCAYTKRIKTPTIVPFSSKITEVYDQPHLFLLNAPSADKDALGAKALAEYFQASHFVILKTAKANEATFVRALKDRLTAQRTKYTELPLSITTAQLNDVLSKHINAVVLPDASDASTLKEVVTKLRSMKQAYATPFTFAGYPEWQLYANQYRADFNNFDTYIFTPFYCAPHGPNVTAFARLFKRAFSATPSVSFPNVAMMGFDAGYYFLTGMMKYGKAFTTQHLGIKGYQSTFSFKQAAPNGGYINNEIRLVRYYD